MLVSGMIIGTIFTLFVVPSIYMLVAKTHTAFKEEAEENVVHGEPVGQSCKSVRGPVRGSYVCVQHARTQSTFSHAH